MALKLFHANQVVDVIVRAVFFVIISNVRSQVALVSMFNRITESLLCVSERIKIK